MQNRYLHLNYLFMFLLGYSLINHIFKHFFFHINFSLVIYSCFYGSLQGIENLKIQFLHKKRQKYLKES